MSTTRIAEHALGILKQDNLWDWPVARRIQASGKQTEVTKFRRIAPKFLHHLIRESLNFGNRVLEQFLCQLGACDKRLEENIETLRAVDFVSAKESFNKLFQGTDPKDVDLQPILDMAAEFFTHLGVAFTNPGRRRSRTGTPCSINEFVGEETERLLEELEDDAVFGTRKQMILKVLSFRRDGHSCLLTCTKYIPWDENGIYPRLAHIIPNSIYNKVDTLECISKFTSTDTSETITQQLNSLGNVMNMQYDARQSYDNLKWGIEAREEDGVVKYYFRLARTRPGAKGPGYIALRDGDEIQFGMGEEGHLREPDPKLCNLRLAVARVMQISAAVDIVLKWKEEADDDGDDGFFIASKEYCDMLDAKLFLSGRAVVV